MFVCMSALSKCDAARERLAKKSEAYIRRLAPRMNY